MLTSTALTDLKGALRLTLDTHEALVKARAEYERLYPARHTSHLFPLVAEQRDDAEKAFVAALDCFEAACEVRPLPQLMTALTTGDSQ